MGSSPPLGGELQFPNGELKQSYAPSTSLCAITSQQIESKTGVSGYLINNPRNQLKCCAVFPKPGVPLTKNTLHETPIVISPAGLCDNFSRPELTGICPNQNVRGSLPSETMQGNCKLFTTFSPFSRKLRPEMSETQE